MASGWNLWVWLECIGVASGRCCKEVYNYIDFLIILLIPIYSTCILALFLQQHSLFILKRFFVLLISYIVRYHLEKFRRGKVMVINGRGHNLIKGGALYSTN